MKKKNTEQNCTIQEFEQKAQELTSMMFMLTESRIHATIQTGFPVGKALAATALAIQAGLDAFIKIERL